MCPGPIVVVDVFRQELGKRPHLWSSGWTRRSIDAPRDGGVAGRLRRGARRSRPSACRASRSMDTPPITVPSERPCKGVGGACAPPTVCCVSLASSTFAIRPFSVLPLRNGRIGHRRNTADLRCARRKRRSRNKPPVTLPRRRTIRVRRRVTGHASTRKGIAVGVRGRETIREGLQEGHDLVLLLVRQGEITGRHVEIVRHLGHWPAVHFLGCARRAV